MKVFKFGGASVKDAGSVKNVAQILRQFPGENIIVVLSAMGKMTNAFEDLTKAYFYNQSDLTSKWHDIKRFHENIVHELFSSSSGEAFQKVNTLFQKLEAYINQPPEAHYKGFNNEGFDFIYDQVVSYGEYLSTTILSEYLSAESLNNRLLDVRKLILTDDEFREANVEWDITVKNIQSQIGTDTSHDGLVVTQGFIGGTCDGVTTTLGREGSDFTAAIFGYAVNAAQVTIWKDVPGLLNADPRYLHATKKIDRISYREAIELAYYGAKIIHPKTIKPLKNKNIPLYVRSFANSGAEGSVITDDAVYDKSIPTYIFKFNQVLISITTRDYSFITETYLHRLYGIFAAHHIKINMMQNSAISLSVCVDHYPERIEQLLKVLNRNYDVKYNEDVELITIRYYTQDAIDKVSKHKKVLLEQRSRITLQLAVKDHFIHNEF
ncbi:MAG: aspartate kinase [Bacteroidales bacterium]|nr:aspartate kinase [Bacteroidales bacterium]